MEEVESIVLPIPHGAINFDAVASIEILTVDNIMFLLCEQHFSLVCNGDAHSFWLLLLHLSVVERISIVKQSLHINIKMYSLTDESDLISMQNPLA